MDCMSSCQTAWLMLLELVPDCLAWHELEARSINLCSGYPVAPLVNCTSGFCRIQLVVFVRVRVIFPNGLHCLVTCR